MCGARVFFLMEQSCNYMYVHFYFFIFCFVFSLGTHVYFKWSNFVCMYICVCF